MWKKIGFNVFYNLGIILSGIGAFWSYNNGKGLLLVALFAIACAFFIYLKINLVKEFRQNVKEEKNTKL